MNYKKAKSIFHFALGILVVFGLAGIFTPAKAQNFSFSYTGPDTLFVDGSCTAILDWGHPATPTAYANSPGGTIVKFEIYSISGGFEMGDPVPAGNTVTIIYQALDNMGHYGYFGFSLEVVDKGAFALGNDRG